jgi:hypothetical protein
MDALEQLKGDLRFVRAAVDRADRHVPPTAIYFLWAVVGFCGFALVDFADRWVPCTGASQALPDFWRARTLDGVTQVIVGR